MIKGLYNIFWKFKEECQEKHIVALAASSSFFFLLCLIPITLLILSATTFILETVTPKNTLSILNYLATIVPDDIMPTFQMLFKHSRNVLSHNQKMKSIHYVILAFSSLGFFGSIWKAVEIITNKTNHGTIFRTFKSFIIIAFSFAFILLIVSAPLIYKSANFLKNFKFLNGIKLKSAAIDSISHYEILGINSLSAIAMFLFFIIFFRFLLFSDSKIKTAILGSAFFTLSMMSTKLLFFNYVLLVKENLIQNYGSLYSFMIFAIWIFTVILLFYMSITFTYILSRKEIEVPEDPLDFFS